MVNISLPQVHVVPIAYLLSFLHPSTLQLMISFPSFHMAPAQLASIVLVGSGGLFSLLFCEQHALNVACYYSTCCEGTDVKYMNNNNNGRHWGTAEANRRVWKTSVQPMMSIQFDVFARGSAMVYSLCRISCVLSNGDTLTAIFGIQPILPFQFTWNFLKTKIDLNRKKKCCISFLTRQCNLV